MDSRSHPELETEIIGDSDAETQEPRRGVVRALVLAVAVGAAIAAGPAVATRLATADNGTNGTHLVPAYQRSSTYVPAPTTTSTPENANQREGRVLTPAPTGENANQREGRTWTPAPTGENANQREGRTWHGSACPGSGAG